MNASSRNEPSRQSQKGKHNDRRNEDRRDTVRKTLDWSFRCLGLGDHLADVSQLGPRPNGGCTDDQRPRGVEGSTGHRATRGYFAGKRFARHERGIQGAGALFNDAIGCNLVAGTNLEEVSDTKFSCGDGAELTIRAVSFNEDCVLCTELKKRT